MKKSTVKIEKNIKQSYAVSWVENGLIKSSFFSQKRNAIEEAKFISEKFICDRDQNVIVYRSVYAIKKTNHICPKNNNKALGIGLTEYEKSIKPYNLSMQNQIPKMIC